METFSQPSGYIFQHVTIFKVKIRFFNFACSPHTHTYTHTHKKSLFLPLVCFKKQTSFLPSHGNLTLGINYLYKNVLQTTLHYTRLFLLFFFFFSSACTGMSSGFPLMTSSVKVSMKLDSILPQCFSLNLASTDLAESHRKIFWHLEHNVGMIHPSHSPLSLQHPHLSVLRRTLLNPKPQGNITHTRTLLEMNFKNEKIDFIIPWSWFDDTQIYSLQALE